MRRGPATFLVFFLVLILGAGFVVLLGSLLAGQIVQMVADLPGYLGAVIGWLNRNFNTDFSRVGVRDSFLHPDWLQRDVQSSATGVLNVSTTVLGGLFRLLTIFLFAFYFAADGPRLRRTLCSVPPPAKQAEVRAPGRSLWTRPAVISTRAVWPSSQVSRTATFRPSSAPM